MSPSQPAHARPRVLMLGPTAPAVGGMATVIDQLMTGPLAQGADLHLFPCNSSENGPRSWCRSAHRHLASAARLARTVRRQRLEIVHIHTCSGFTFYRNVLDMHIARRCGAKVILHIHGARFDAFCSHASKFQQAIIRQSLESADRVIVLSQHWQQLLSPFAPQARFQVVPNGVAIEPQAKDIRAATEYRAATTEGDQGGSLKERSSGPPAPARERSPAPPPPCRFLFLAAICPRKGIDVLIEAASRLASRNIPQHLTIAGPEETPGEADWLRNAIRTARIEHSVSFVGPITGQAKADLLAESDCLVLPSRAEGLPLTLLEAGASSLPVIATTVGAIPEVIYSRELGILVPPADAAALAAAMTDLAADRPKRHRLGANLHQRVATTYSLERQSGLLAAIYRDLNQPRFVSVPLTRALLAGVDL